MMEYFQGDSDEGGNQRNLLLTQWAQISKWIKYQPLDNVKEYFGVRFALYFTWLGFYTHMLIPASIIGLICFGFGLVTLNSNTLRYFTIFSLCKESNFYEKNVFSQ